MSDPSEFGDWFDKCVFLEKQVEELEAEVDALKLKYDCAVVQDKLKAESIADYKAEVEALREIKETAKKYYTHHRESDLERLWELLEKDDE